MIEFFSYKNGSLVLTMNFIVFFSQTLYLLKCCNNNENTWDVIHRGLNINVALREETGSYVQRTGRQVFAHFSGYETKEQRKRS